MSQLLSENYQSGIYWAAINAEQARERAANAELDYWTKRAEKDGLVVRVERADGQTSTVDDESRTGREEIQAPPVAPGEQPPQVEVCGMCGDFLQGDYCPACDVHVVDEDARNSIAPSPPAQERASDADEAKVIVLDVNAALPKGVMHACVAAQAHVERIRATAAKQAREEALEEITAFVENLCTHGKVNAGAIRALRFYGAVQPSPQKEKS